MLYFFGTWVILSLYVVRLRLAYSSEEVLFDRHADSYLDGFVIRAKRTNTEVECGIYCTSEPLCVSANFKVEGVNRGLCELNSEVLEDFPGTKIQNTDFVYLAILERVRIL
jgi:hypothetical protein